MASTAALLLKMALSAGLAYLTLRLRNNAAQRERRQGQLCAIRQVQVQRWRREKRVRQRRQKQEGRQLLTYAQYMREKRQFQFEQEGEGEEEEVGEAGEAGEAGMNSEKEGMTTTGTEDYRECLSSNESVAASQNN